MSTFWMSFAVAILSSRTYAQSTISLNFSSTPQGSISEYINPSFAGFGIEPSNLFSFTGGAEPNELSINLLGNLANYTGAPPYIRLGGNTQDYMIYEPSQDEYAWIRNPDPKGVGAFPPDYMVIGPKFFEVANRFPTGTPVTWGLNMAYEEADYVQQIVLMAQQVLLNVPNLRLNGFEIGNEPDLYLENGFRNGTWNGMVYTNQWLTRANAIWEQVLKPQNLFSNFFEPAATASTIGTDFQIKDLVSFDIDVQANDSDTSYISTWNQHDYYYYIGVSGYALTMELFMTLSTTNDQFAAWVTQVQQAHDTPYPYALREMGVVGPIGLAGITDVFAASLWTLNFFLYAATLNITSVEMHMTDDSNASAWQPIEIYGQGPHVRPNYYAFAAFDQIIGSSCQAQISPYTIVDYPENYNGHVNAYSVYQAGQLDTIVIINTLVANVSDTNKANLTVDLNLPSSWAGKTLHLAYLTAEGADAKSGTTWNGISFEQNNIGTASTVDDTDYTVMVGNDGGASIEVRDTQAVAAAIDRRIGTGLAPNKAACAALSSKSATATRTGSANSSSKSGSSDGSKANNASKRTESSMLVILTLGVATLTGMGLIWT